MVIRTYAGVNRLSVCLSIPLSVGLPIRPYVRPSICPSVHLSIYLSVYLSFYPVLHSSSTNPSIYQSTNLSIHQSIYHQSIHLSIHPSIDLSIQSIHMCAYSCLYICIPYTSSTAQGGGGSFENRKPIGEVGCCESRMAERTTDGSTHAWIVGLPIFLSIHVSIHPSIYLSDYLTIYLTSFKKGKFSAEPKVPPCHETVRRGHTKCCTVTQNHLSIPEDLTLQNATPLKKSAPWPPNNLWWTCCLLYRACHAKCIFADLFKCAMPETATKPSHLLTFGKVPNPLRLLRETTSERPNVVRDRQFFALLASKCASRQRHALFQHLNSDTEAFCPFWLRNVLRTATACTFSTSQLPKVLRHDGAFYILTSKCAPRHKGALFQHLNFQKRFETEALCAFWLRNVLRATTAWTFWTSQLRQALLTWGALYILTSKCASRHNGVHVSSTLRSPKTLEKHSASRLSYLFGHLDLLSSDFLFSDLLSSSLHLCFSILLFQLSVLSEV